MGVCVVEVWCVGVCVGAGCALKQLAGDLWVARFEVFKRPKVTSRGRAQVREG